ncbi:hypothetical protein GCM10010177_39500 [Actinomadura citrea]|nr:hypothetical protein GCM10010177_39500 [Actinomadura citrea]
MARTVPSSTCGVLFTGLAETTADWEMSAEAVPVAAGTVSTASAVAVRQAMVGRMKVLRDAAGDADGILSYHIAR